MLKVLLLDIETLPNEAYVWQVWKENIYPEKLKKEWFMLSWSAKWLGQKRIYSEILSKEEIKREDDSSILVNLRSLIDEADVLITHNGDRFDIPAINTRFIMNDIKPPSPPRSIDTLKICRRLFKFNHNTLNSVARNLGVGEKTEHKGFKLWGDCKRGNRDALRLMKKYNKNDVIILEKVYEKLKPFVPNHPNLSVNEDDLSCRSCGSTNVEKRGFRYTNISKFQRYVCNDCGSWSSARQNLKNKEQMSVTVAKG